MRTKLVISAVLMMSTASLVSSAEQRSAVRKSRPGSLHYLLRTDDHRLGTSVEFTARSGRVGALAVGLEDAGQIQLRVSGPLADARASILNGRASLRSLLGGLEWGLGARWGSREGREPYQLVPDQEARLAAAAKAQREAKLALKARWETVGRWSHLDTEGLAELAKSEPEMARVFRHPRGSQMGQLVYGLPEGVINTLWDKGIVRIPVASLPDKLQELAAGAAKTNNRFDQQRLKDEGWITLQLGGTADRQTVWASIFHKSEGVDFNVLFAEGWVRQNPADRRRSALQHPTPAPKDPLFKKRVTLKDPSYPPSGYTRERYANALPLLPLVEQVADQTGAVVVVATDYRPRPDEVAAKRNDPKKDSAWLSAQWWLSGPVKDEPLPRALDLLCADFEYEWSYVDGVVVLRHKRWYVDEESDRPTGKPLAHRIPPFTKY